MNNSFFKIQKRVLFIAFLFLIKFRLVNLCFVGKKSFCFKKLDKFLTFVERYILNNNWSFYVLLLEILFFFRFAHLK